MRLGVLLIFTFKLIYNYREISSQDYVPTYNYPVNTVKYIKENLDYSNIRLLTHFDFGSYVEFEGIKSFIDSRTEVFCEEFNDVTILHDWWDYYYSYGDAYAEKLENLINKYNLTHILCFSDDYYGIYYMDDSQNYTKLYSDEDFYLYEYHKNN